MNTIYRITLRFLLKGLWGILIFILLPIASLYGQTTLPVTSLIIREKAGVTTTNYPLTFAHVFKRGDVKDTMSVMSNGSTLPTQIDVKRRYDDGSIRHALISVVLPQITAYEDLGIELVESETMLPSAEMTKTDILATEVQSVIELMNLSGSGYSGSFRADLRQALQDVSEFRYWLKGSIVTEVLVTQQLNKSINAAWEVRIYPGWKGIRLSHSIENVEADYRGNVAYAVNIHLGKSNVTRAYSKPLFTHYHNARWRKILWLGQEPPEVEIRYDLEYLKESGHIMNYDPTLQIPEHIVNITYQEWLTSAHDIMDTSIITTYFPTTGGRAEIGILPAWTVKYLYTMDNRMKKMMLNLAELASGAPIHYRESDPLKSFHGHILSIDNRPSVWPGRNDFKYIAEEDRLPAAIGSTETIWHVDRAHQASFAYIPYLITGEYYYLEEMYYWAGYDLAASNFHQEWGRDYTKGLLRDQVRGEAWAIRNIADAAALAPDEDIEKVYFENKVVNNIQAWRDEKIHNPSTHPLHTWGYISCRERDGGRSTDALIGCTQNPKTGTGSASYENIYPVRHTSLPWQDDFMLLCLQHLLELGYPAQDLHRWIGEYAINRFTHPDVNPYNGASYRYPATYTEHIAALKPYFNIQTWKQANDSFLEQPSAFPANDYPTSYRYIALGALSTVVEYGVSQNTADGSTYSVTGQQAYEWVRSNVQNKEDLSADPSWAFVPRRTIQVKDQSSQETEIDTKN